MLKNTSDSDFKSSFKSKASTMTGSGVLDLVKRSALPVEFEHSHKFLDKSLERQKIIRVSTQISLRDKLDQFDELNGQKRFNVPYEYEEYNPKHPYLLENCAYPLTSSQIITSSKLHSESEIPNVSINTRFPNYSFKLDRNVGLIDHKNENFFQTQIYNSGTQYKNSMEFQYPLRGIEELKKDIFIADYLRRQLEVEKSRFQIQSQVDYN